LASTDGEDRIEQVVLADLLVGEERLRHRSRIGHAGRLDDDPVEFKRAGVALLPERAEDPDQVAAHCAADAAVVHFDDLLVRFLDDRAVDADLAELVLDHRDALAVVFLEDAVQQRRLARAEKAGEDRHRHHVVLLHERNPESKERDFTPSRAADPSGTRLRENSAPRDGLPRRRSAR
jgi:hypothetical protein